MNKPLIQGSYSISMEEYIDDPCPEPSASKGTLYSLLFSSAEKAWHHHPRLNPNYKHETADKFDKGTACHSLLLEGTHNIIVLDGMDWKKPSLRIERDQYRAEGKTVLLQHQYDDALKMAESAQKQIHASELGIEYLRSEGDVERTYIWVEATFGRYVRTRPDWVSEDRSLIIDYKTTGVSANPNSYASIIINNGLDIQSSLQRMAVRLIDGVIARHVTIVQETEEPYACSFIGLTPMFESMGDEKVDLGLFRWNQCMASGKWEGYPKKIAYLEPPAWALAYWEAVGETVGEDTEQ